MLFRILFFITFTCANLLSAMETPNSLVPYYQMPKVDHYPTNHNVKFNEYMDYFGHIEESISTDQKLPIYKEYYKAYSEQFSSETNHDEIQTYCIMLGCYDALERTRKQIETYRIGYLEYVRNMSLAAHAQILMLNNGLQSVPKNHIKCRDELLQFFKEIIANKVLLPESIRGLKQCIIEKQYSVAQAWHDNLYYDFDNSHFKEYIKFKLLSLCQEPTCRNTERFSKDFFKWDLQKAAQMKDIENTQPTVIQNVQKVLDKYTRLLSNTDSMRRNNYSSEINDKFIANCLAHIDTRDTIQI